MRDAEYVRAKWAEAEAAIVARRPKPFPLGLVVRRCLVVVVLVVLVMIAMGACLS